MLSNSNRNHAPEVVAEVSALVHEWRNKAMSIMMILCVVIVLPPLLMVIFSQRLHWSWTVRGISLALFLVLLAAVWRRDWSYPRRALIFFSAAYGFTALRLMTSGLAGSGRMGLMLFPIIALILVGSRAGWLAAGVSIAMFAGFTVLASTGILAGKMIIHENSADLAFWLLQWLMLLASLIPLMVLLTRFQAFQTKIMIDERLAHRQIEAATAERRQLEREIIRISEQEQRRLGSELHDGLCQQLTAALLASTAIENDLSARRAPESAASHRLRALLEDCIGSAYDAAKGLCPVDMNSESLAPALRRLGWQVQKHSGIECEINEIGSQFILDPQTTLHLYRIAQEAVNNAIKHANCRRIALELCSSDEYCVLRIIDNGEPVVSEVDHQFGGMGIQIMNYRAKIIGGTLRIERLRSGGISVSCFVPCFRATPCLANTD